MAERYIPEHRRTQFKARNQFRPDELRRRREEQQVEIRRQKREENLAKRRGIQTSEGAVGVGGAAAESDDEASAIESEVCLATTCLYAVISFVFLIFPLLPVQPLGFFFLLGGEGPSTAVKNRLSCAN